MRIKKGEAGYITARKKNLGLQTILGFGIVGAFLLAGYLKTYSRSNLFTIIAVLGCLPSAKALTEWIAIFPYQTVDRRIVEEVKAKSSLLTTAYDLVITSRDRIMPVDAVVISNRTVFGYAGNPKTNTEKAAKHIRDILAENQYSKVTVKIFTEYVHFLSRAEGLNNIIEVDHSADRELEEAIRQIILNISM